MQNSIIENKIDVDMAMNAESMYFSTIGIKFI